MEFIKKFLKPKWQHNNPDIRRQALADLTTVEQLTTFIAAETEAELRVLAVSRIADHSVLEDLLGHNRDDVRQAARERWLQLLMPSGSSIDGIADTRVLVRIAGLTNDQDLRLQAIARIQDEQERFNIASSHPVARVRLIAAEGIQSAALLQQLQDVAQGKDKAVYRLCKDRLATYKAEEEARAAEQERIQHLTQQVHQLTRLGYGPDFNGRLQVLSKQALELDSAFNAEQKAEIRGELDKAAAILRQHDEEEQRRIEEQQRREATALQQQQLVSAIDEVMATCSTNSDAAALQQQLQQLDTDWRASQSEFRANAEQIRHFENAMQQGLAAVSCLQQLSEQREALDHFLEQKTANELDALQKDSREAGKWLQRLKWPEALGNAWWVAPLNQRQAAAEAATRELNQQQQSRIDTLKRQLDNLEQLLQNGHLKDASKLFGQVNTGLRQVDQRAAQPLQRQARAIGARLTEMRDWQGYVTTPKKEALCEAMESLIGADIAPDILADRIQAMQDEWKALSSSQPDRELWERFQAAGDKAFEPCRDHFAQVARQREQNVEYRNQLIAELDRYESELDWASADWKVVQKTLETARDTFRSYSPVDRSSHNDTQKRFTEVCDRIYAHIQQEYDRNLDLKSELVERAAAEIETDDLTSAIDTIKQLQQEWKQVGLTPRAADQRLWKQFRAHCDAVFNRLDQARAERKARLDDTVLQAEQLLEQARELLTTDDDTQQLLNRLEELEQDFAAMELPRSAHQRLRKGFTEVAGALQNLEDQARLNAERARWQGILDRLQALADNDEALWQDAAELPPEYQSLPFDAAWQDRQQACTDAAAAIDLCIQMEVLAGQESPAADQGRRMALQVQRLAQGLGQSVDVDNERLQLLAQWLPLHADAALQSRFRKAFASSL